MSECPQIDTVLIGDTHADLDIYRAMLRQEEAKQGRPLPSIHVGDYGFGYFSPREEQAVAKFHQENRRHRFICGNHDRPDLVKSAMGFLPDGALSGGVLFLGGADGGQTKVSTEISARDMKLILVQLRNLTAKPSVIISHDAPQKVAQALRDDMTGEVGPISESRTRRFLAEVQQIIQPGLWIFGHWHHGWAKQIGATYFRGMGFQESFTMALPWNPYEIKLLI